ncbi:GNAT family N-acetyltransferase [Inhella gelatinilytica]|uniref:GNAT family N-acetyltransferase n=1 Tax=Inhella gelatinilytica TaxID=2795030 RepID=A0A931NE93_9BURK|nr:GNAT family N-acetyltransferase [Inhella gelatinilytica]MBH9553444.1 GNAT family N-acetyltransferase [Inhella gelatinilytica]
MTLTLSPTDQIPLDRLHATFGQAFSDYVAGPFQLTFEQWPGFLARHGVDLALGRGVADAKGDLLGFALVAPRPALGRWRLGAMGLVPAARGSGAAQLLLEDFFTRATAASVTAVELEVIAQNPRAVALYERQGFVRQHALMGFSWAGRPSPSAVPGAEVQAVTAVPADAALAWLQAAERTLPDLPLQVGPVTLAALSEPWTAWQAGQAQLVFTGSEAEGWLLRSLIDLDPDQPGAEALLRAFCATHGAQTIRVHPLQRLDVGGEALLRCGFTQETLHQWIMRRDLPRAEAPTIAP